MPSFALTDATTYIGGYDWTTDLNEVALSVSADELDTTTFGAGGYRQRIAGLRNIEGNIAGFWDSAATDAPDPRAFSSLGVVDREVTMSPAGVEGATAYFFRGGSFTYEAFGAVGEATPFSLDLKCSNGTGLVRGSLLKAKGTVSATGATGTAVNLGTTAAGKYLYGVLHVLGTPGTTITAVLESDDSNTFPSPTTRITFGPATVNGGVWGTRVAGSITDNWYRIRVTAITGTFTVAAAAGIA